MPSPNYGFEKRQRELAKKRKKEDKLKAKADRKAGVPPEDGSEGASDEPGLPGGEAANDGAPATPPPAA